MSGFLGIGGSSASTDRKMQLQSSGGLSNLFNWALPQGQQAVGAGMSDLSSAGGFFKSLVSGNRTALNQTIAPQVNAANATSDAQKRQLSASGTARGGGTAPANQTRDTDIIGKIQNALFSARSGAAGELAKVGGAEANVGTSLASTAGTAISNLGELGTEARKLDVPTAEAQGSAMASIALQLLFG
jgi:hypothetical protein